MKCGRRPDLVNFLLLHILVGLLSLYRTNPRNMVRLAWELINLRIGNMYSIHDISKKMVY